MSGQWEQYVEKAAEAQEQFWAPLRGHTDYPDEIDFGLARAVLAAVAPLIAEDTRTRMVEAAGKIVEREGLASMYFCPSAGEIEQHPGGGFDVCCEAPERHEPITPAALAAAKRLSGWKPVEVTIEDETDRKYVFNGDEADDVWVDRP